MKFIHLVLVFLVQFAQSAVLTVADFVFQPTYTTSYMWSNYVGIVLNLKQVYDSYNQSTFQGYMLNSNIKGSWSNNFAYSLRMPKNWYYDCAAVGINASNTADCQKQLKGNETFFSQLGQFVWNTAAQPYWTFGFNNQMLNFSNAATKSSFLFFLLKVYTATYKTRYQAEMMWQGDKAVANGMKTTMTPDIFLAQAALYEQIIYGLTYKAPGLSEDAGSDWLSIIPTYYTKVVNSIFSFEPVIFRNASQCTIESLLNDNYTKGYLTRRFKVNSTFSYTNFSQLTTLERVRIVDGEGIDGVTNTFAAAIWWADFLIQSALYGLYDVTIQGARRSGNYQSVFGSPPNFTPTSLYYASLFVILAAEQKPRIMIPSLAAGISSNIKVWGFETVYLNKFLILNKDTNSSLSGKVNLQAKAKSGTKCSCIYLQAPSLSSKAEDMRMAGHYFTYGNSTPQGNYSTVQYSYISDIKGFAIDIKYAQMALCEIPNANIVIPTKDTCHEDFLTFAVLLLIVTGFMF